MSTVKPTTIADHVAVVENIKEEAMAIPKDDVPDPDMPVESFLQENRTVITACEEHYDALVAKGFERGMLEAHSKRVDALDSAQILWKTERGGGRSEEAVTTIDQAEECRGDLLAGSDLALRHNDAGLDRIAQVREGDGLPDLIADLGDLPVILTDYRPEFEAIKLDVDAEVNRAATSRKALMAILAEDKVAGSLSGYKELRDRIFVLCKETLDEIQMFAHYAFRKDKTNNRRKLFTSDYNRRKRARRKSKSANTAS